MSRMAPATAFARSSGAPDRWSTRSRPEVIRRLLQAPQLSEEFRVIQQHDALGVHRGGF
jgi:hypothetical protein